VQGAPGIPPHQPAQRLPRRWAGVLVSVVALVAWLVLGATSSNGASAPAVECGRPAKLELHRFEDGSARLLCGRRVLVRVEVPW
jgi:hypothetical protein